RPLPLFFIVIPMSSTRRNLGTFRSTFLCIFGCIKAWVDDGSCNVLRRSLRNSEVSVSRISFSRGRGRNLISHLSANRQIVLQTYLRGQYVVRFATHKSNNRWEVFCRFCRSRRGANPGSVCETPGQQSLLMV